MVVVIVATNKAHCYNAIFLYSLDIQIQHRVATVATVRCLSQPITISIFWAKLSLLLRPGSLYWPKNTFFQIILVWHMLFLSKEMKEGVKSKIVCYTPDSHALSQILRIKVIENQRDRLRSARNETKLHRLRRK